MASEVMESTGSRDSTLRRETPEEAEFLDHPEAAFLGFKTRGANDESARLVHEFTPTRYELGELACHYLEWVYTIDYNWAALMTTGSWEIRFQPFAYGRLDTIAALLGEEEFQAAIRLVEEKWEGWEEELAAELAKEIPCLGCGKSFRREVIYQEECLTCGEKADLDSDVAGDK